MKGINFGTVVVPESRMSSNLYLVIAHKTDPAIHMPPHHEKALAEGRGTSLTEVQIETIGAWIDQGAKENQRPTALLPETAMKRVKNSKPADSNVYLGSLGTANLITPSPSSAERSNIQ